MTTSGLDAAMAAVGDRWTLLVVDALMDGPRRFSDLQQAIPKWRPTCSGPAASPRGPGPGGGDGPTRTGRRGSSTAITEAGRDLAGALRLLGRWGRADAGGEVEGPTTVRAAPPSRPAGTARPAQRVTEQADDDLRWV